jgi:hypothetical protein
MSLNVLIPQRSVPTGGGTCSGGLHVASRCVRGPGSTYKSAVLWLAGIAVVWVLATVVVLPLVGRCLGSADRDRGIAAALADGDLVPTPGLRLVGGRPNG